MTLTPGVAAVGQGIDVFDPKFNIVSPGADADVYFPFTQEDKRLKKFHPELKELLYGAPEKGKSVGQLKDKHKPIIFRWVLLPCILMQFESTCFLSADFGHFSIIPGYSCIWVH